MFNELKFIKNNKMLIVALIAIGLLPLIYVALFVGSIWNPYDKTDQLKISIVNEDKAATLQGKKINIGDEVVSKLKDNKKFDFQEVSKDTAKKQLKNGKAIGTIIIPEDASKNATTLLNKNPKKIELETQVNPGSSYTGSQAAQKAIDTVTKSIRNTVRAEYLDELFAANKQSKQGYTDTSKALGQMSQAEGQLINGNEQVTAGLKQMAPMAGAQGEQLVQGNEQVTQGLQQLQQNNEQLKQKIDQAVEKQTNVHFENENEQALNDIEKVTENNITKADYYGETVLPYMASVGLFVGAVSFAAIYPLTKTLRQDVAPWKQWLGKVFLYVLQGSFSAIMLSLWVKFGLGLDIENIGKFLTVMFLWAIAAIAVTSLLVLLLDRVGLFLAMLLLVLQLSSSEGMFPIEMSAAFFRFIHPFSPMSYAIQGFREAIFTNAGHFTFGFVAAILSGIALGAMLIQYLVLIWFNKRGKPLFQMKFN
ncbi:MULTISPECIES: YhgE/Pip family protein [Staphylococcus]|uniref:YhgE/Pip family protein n=1 Tax=Staphylococcus TaxID=1279 RepID=UPI00070B7F76|nr:MULTISPECIES: YhgE/Pip family protein [Staphylococcus]AMG97323.1 DUF3533 domain-containing protein [Staphylococcus simulans]ATF30402.1 YhgE/Pip domain-containing protein [Staphylococcus simulans]MDK7925850.1 YhgE/Pip family protein [Staphylococcus simulans]MDK8314507.1 YhgE/Pip family protein [Staphylococcus simulans]OHR56826.1 YhgE/Pip domain-containing protein [Staphylococcus sp. HMSC061G12]